MPYYVAVTDSPAGEDLSIEREVLGDMRVEKASWPEAADLERALADCDAVLCMHAPISRRLIQSLGHCRAIVRYGTGLDNIDLQAASDARIPVAGVRDYCTEEVANHTIALLLAWNRRILEYSEMVRSGMWNQRRNTTGNWGYPVERLSGSILGLLGFGSIGKAVAARAIALGMRVLAHSRSLTTAEASRFNVEPVDRITLFARSDFVSLHLPLNAETAGMIGRDAIASFKPGCVLINTARGGLVEEQAVVEALQSGRLGGAILDVYQCAPLPPGRPIRECRNVILTPHVAFYSEGALNELRRRAAEQIRAHLST
jgi:D-3-phosphoglycerate dehydrogenase / 2-oxoglutarate reductase